MLLIPSPEEQWSVQSLARPESWGRRDIGSWHAQNSAILTVMLTATASDTITNKGLHAFSIDKYSGIAADSCWQIVSSIGTTF